MNIVTRHHCDDDWFVRMFYVAMDWDCYECNCVLTIKSRTTITEIEAALVEAGWFRHTDVRGRWTCPDCQKAKSGGSSIPRTSKESFWYGCS